jgi:tRNA1(Val) A37 N6-methylase TrmN6
MGSSRNPLRRVFCWLSIGMNRWKDFYQVIRDSTWPECVNEHEFTKLPEHIQHEILTTHNGKTYLEVTQDDIIDVFVNDTQLETDCLDLQFPVANDFNVYYNASLDGGGNSFSERYPLILKYLYPNRVFDNCLEWCGGHGVIGFRLLADGICNNLHFLEMYQPAIDACSKTIEHMPNRFKGKVSWTQSSTVKKIPEHLKFDLVVSNPPHFPLLLGHKLFEVSKNHHQRITVDKEWQTHKDFFTNIANNLAQDGVVLLQEIYHIDEFAEMIDHGNLKITKMFTEKNNLLPWYLELTHK